MGVLHRELILIGVHAKLQSYFGCFWLFLQYLFYGWQLWVWPFFLATCTKVAIIMNRDVTSSVWCYETVVSFPSSLALNKGRGKTTEMSYRAHFWLYHKMSENGLHLKFKYRSPSFWHFWIKAKLIELQPLYGCTNVLYTSTLVYLDHES